MKICSTLLIIFYAIRKIANAEELATRDDPIVGIPTFASNLSSGTAVLQDIIQKLFPSGLRPLDELVFKSVQEMIEYYGYPCETHYVNSSNYRLEMHRIPHGINITNNTNPKIPVFLTHGFGTSSDLFVLNPPSESIGFILADLGYDVWLGNIRGNVHSRLNYNLSEYEPAFWDFEFDDCIQFDVPNMIDYILNNTGQPKIFYMGYSLGTTIGLGLFADKPEYNDKVIAFLAMAPAILIGDPNGFFKVVSNFVWVLQLLPNMKVSGEINPSVFTIPIVSDLLEDVLEWNAAYSLGDSIGTLNRTRLAVYGSHGLAGASLKTIIHYGQLIQSGKFQKYDYGIIENWIRYSQSFPPLYDLSKVTVPTYIYVAKNDLIATPEAAQLAALAIPNCKGVFEVGTENNGHLWYVVGPDANQNLYPMVVNAMKTEQNSI